MKHQNNKLKKISGRLLLFTTVLFLLAASRGVAQCIPSNPQVDLQGVSIDPSPGSIGIGQAATITAVMANGGPCPIPIGEATAQVSLSAFYLDLGTPFNFTSNCGQWTYLGNVPGGSGTAALHNLFFRNDAGPIPVGGPLCFFTFDVKGKAITPPVRSDISLGSSLSATATTSDRIGTNQSASTQIIVTENILPVVVSDFSITASSCNGILNWKTASEDNVDRFEVEYSANGFQFTKAGTVQAKNSAAGATYKYVNDQGTSRGYYRLKIIDRDGQFTYSRTVSIDTRCTGKKSVSIYPNPLTANQNLTVIASGYEGNIKGELVAVSGQVIRTFNLKNGTNTLPVEQLAQSTYMLRITDASGQAESFRVVIIK